MAAVTRAWLDASRDRIAAATGDAGSGPALADEAIAAILDLARVAAHESGDRTNAPLAAYLVGVAHGCHPERSLAELVAAASGPGAG